MRRVYMDANATTPLLPEVMEAMRPYWMEHFGNASSIHLHGQHAHAAVDRARETMAEFFNCHAAEVVFNSGGTEGDNSAIFGLLRPGDHFVTTSIEHSAILEAAKRLTDKGIDTTFVAPQPSGLIDPEDIRRVLRPETRLISVMLANNETGVLQPVEEIGKIARAAGAFFHIDAVQGAGKVELDVRRFGCHLCSISAHKMHGPKGIGAMFIRRGTPIEPLLVGGSHERRRRAGTENVPGIVGLAKAAELAMHSLEDGTINRLAALRDRLEAGLLQIPGTGVNGSHAQTSFDCHPERASFDCPPERAQRVEGPASSFSNDNAGAPGPGSPRTGLSPGGGGSDFRTWESTNVVPRVANTTNIWFDQLEGEALVIALDLKGVCISGGSACHSGATEPSHVLMAMGLDETRARASLRFSLLKTATEADVDYVLQVVPEAVEHLRALSPVAAGTLG
jgi:cysteine desulfurase